MEQLALHKLDFCLYFSLQDSILSCVTVRPTTYLQHLNCHFHIWYPLTIYSQIKHWNMLYHVYTHIVIFSHIRYKPVSTQAHNINQNNFLGMPRCNPCQRSALLDSHHLPSEASVIMCVGIFTVIWMHAPWDFKNYIPQCIYSALFILIMHQYVIFWYLG